MADGKLTLSREGMELLLEELKQRNF
ncbi:hypothetical protein [Priestia megaterium]